MLLTPPQLLDLSARCAPEVASSTMMAVVEVESGLDPLAIGVNGRRHMRFVRASKAEATATAERLIAGGANIDLGLGQINSRNLARLGLSISDALDPCLNLAASARILRADYMRAATWSGDGQSALLMALSLYNTGDARRGFANGYVGRVGKAAGAVSPSLQRYGPIVLTQVASTPSPRPWDVFAAPALSVSGFVFSPTSQGANR